ncbi:MAG: FAD-dependent oxidoreductase [Janthinobacterium lividum]
MNATTMRHADLSTLERQVENDLKQIAHPHLPWVLPHRGPDGAPMLDVLIIGAGQSGITAAFGLQRDRIDNVLVIDQAPYGKEGPWSTYARMHTLRNPKDYTGPDLDVPSLTCQSWFEAVYGAAAWEALEIVSKDDWAAYLLWVRKMTGVRVENDTALVALDPVGIPVAPDAVDGMSDQVFAATLRTDAGTRIVHARKIVLATGQESMGRWTLPHVIEALPAACRARAADPIDFAALRGRRVVVIGAGASAFDNAGAALEAGASDVKLLCRRMAAQVVQPYRWLTFRGFLRHFSALDDAWRWRFMNHVFQLREGFTQATYDRCIAHDTFDVVTGAELHGAQLRDGAVHLQTAAGDLVADFVICAIGIEIDVSRRPELAAAAGNIATWGDRYTPPDDEKNPRMGGFPYLNDDYSFAEKVPGLTPWLRNVHLFSIASTVSFGPSGSSINALTTAIPKLVTGVGRGLFCDDVERYWRSLNDYDVPQAVLRSR